MRRFILAILLGSIASPAFAAFQDKDRSGRRFEARGEREDRSEQRSERSQPAASDSGERRAPKVDPPRVRSDDGPRERPDFQRRQANVPVSAGDMNIPPERAVRRSDTSRRSLGGFGTASDRPVQVPVTTTTRTETSGTETAPPATRRPITDSVREWRSEERRRANSPSEIERRNLRRAPLGETQGGELVEQERSTPRVFDQDRRVSRTPMPGTQPPATDARGDRRGGTNHGWSHDWRRDGRYDWRDHRRRHRSLFRLAFYVDPFGWGYQRYNIGWRLWPRYYGSSYWLNDPWRYRLPPAYGPYRWIRYHDDALLVNIYTGEVVDVIYDFFW